MVIHIGSNDNTKFNYHDVNMKDLGNRIIEFGLKCEYYGVESTTISSVLVRNTLREKSPYSDFFWFLFSRIRTE